MNIPLKYKGSYCDKRIIDLGFVDNSWSNNVTGSVFAEINGNAYEIFCPLPIEDQGDSHSGFKDYTISVNDGFVDGRFTAEEVLEFIKAHSA